MHLYIRTRGKLPHRPRSPRRRRDPRARRGRQSRRHLGRRLAREDLTNPCRTRFAEHARRSDVSDAHRSSRGGHRAHALARVLLRVALDDAPHGLRSMQRKALPLCRVWDGLCTHLGHLPRLVVPRSTAHLSVRGRRRRWGVDGGSLLLGTGARFALGLHATPERVAERGGAQRNERHPTAAARSFRVVLERACCGPRISRPLTLRSRLRTSPRTPAARPAARLAERRTIAAWMRHATVLSPRRRTP